MAKSINASAKRRGRPVTTGTGTTIGVRMLADPLAALDAWIAKQNEPDLTRPEAIRRLVELGLTVKMKDRAKGEHPRQRAREMAGNAIDKMTDTTASPNDRASRKQRLIKGPEEFQELRVDRPRRKR